MTLNKNENQRVYAQTAGEDDDDTVVNSYTTCTMAGGFVENQYQLAKTHRSQYESAWIKWFDQFRGRYSPEERQLLARIKDKNPYASEAFIKVTKTKTLAAYGSVLEVLTYGNKFPLTIQATPEPEGVAEKVYIAQAEDQDSVTIEDIAAGYGFPGDGKELERGSTYSSMFGGLAKKYNKLFQGKDVVEGDSPDKVTSPEFHPAKEAAKNMTDTIQDQLMESDCQEEIEKLIWEMTLFGTGVLKGPFTHKEMQYRWEHTGEGEKPIFKPTYKLKPKIKAPSLWDVYPDPHAKITGECDFVIERHKLTRAQIQKLKSQPKFNSELIDIAMRSAPGVEQEHWDTRLRDSGMGMQDNRYEVLEFWGNISAEAARMYDISDVPDDLEGHDQIQVNIWAVNGVAIKKVINPFIPERVPYFFVPYEAQKYQLWGIGVPENMDDAQRMINVHTRAAQDNLQLAGSVMLEVNEAQLAPGQDNSIYAGKIWRKQGGAPGQSIYPISFNNTAPQHFQFIGEANRWADQASGIPSIMHGQTGISGTGRTATSLSMIMNSGNLSIRTVIKNIDRHLIKPLGEALFNWNMQFNEDSPDIRGDIKVIATGTSALSQREVQSQRILTFLQVTANPNLAPHTNIRYLIKELAITLDLDPDEALNDPEIAKLYMELTNANRTTGQGTQAGVPVGSVGGPEQAAGQPTPDNGGGAGGGSIGVNTGTITGQGANPPAA